MPSHRLVVEPGRSEAAMSRAAFLPSASIGVSADSTRAFESNATTARRSPLSRLSATVEAACWTTSSRLSPYASPSPSASGATVAALAIDPLRSTTTATVVAPARTSRTAARR